MSIPDRAEIETTPAMADELEATGRRLEREGFLATSAQVLIAAARLRRLWTLLLASEHLEN